MLRYKIQIVMSRNNTTSILCPGEFVREDILKSKNLSVTDAAKILGVGRPAFSNFLNGNSSLSTDMAARIERAFGVPAQKLHDLQASYDAAQTKGAPANTKAYVPPFLGIVAKEIEAWAERNIAGRARFSVLLRTLVNSTGIGLTNVDFPGNDDAERPGWDGFVMASEGTPWIPEGRSGWEFGLNAKPKEKADKDYAKSINALEKSGRKEITFVFVTPTHWPGKKQWAKERKAEKHWKDVRAYDSSDLEQWLEQSVAGQTWFSNETKRASNGTRSLDQCWYDWSQATEPPLEAALFKAACKAARSRVESILTRAPTEPTIITADSTEEAVAFLAELFSERGGNLYTFRDRVIVFDSPGVFPKLAMGASNFIAVTANRDVEREFAPCCQSIHTFVIYPRNVINTEPHILLEPLSYDTFYDALKEMGYELDEINRLNNESGRSLTVLRRRVSKIPAIKTPTWATDSEIASDLAPFMLAGAWNSHNSCDQIILSHLANNDNYNDLEKRLQKYARLNDAPVWAAGTFRGVISKIDLLFAVSSTITKSELEAYFEAAQLVLSEDDPSLDLPEKDRPFANLYKKTREISRTLRDGISETLVLLSVHGNTLFQSRLGMDIEMMAILLVRDLLGNPLSSRRLEAHNYDLPTYAEAAPEEFLTIIERDLKTDNSASLELMRPANTGLFSSAPRAGLLMALEILAWPPLTLTRVAFILAKLAEVKLEDNVFNKPIESLKSIFRSWLPQTAASMEKRIAVIKLLANRFPRVAWEICIDQFGLLLQPGHYNQKPRWRNSAQGYGGRVSSEEQLRFVEEVADMTLNWNQYDQSMLCDLIERLHSLDDSRQERIWEIIKNWANTADDFDKALVREKIRVSVMSRKGIVRSKKAKTEALHPAAKVAYASLEPEDLLNKYEWLFRDTWVEESFDEVHSDIDDDEREIRIKGMRIEALYRITEEKGIEGVLTLAEKGKAATLIGTLMVSSILPSDNVVNFIIRVSDSDENSKKWTFKNLIRGAFQSLKEDKELVMLFNKLNEVLPPERLLKILEQAPFKTPTWKFIEGMGDLYQQIYWTSVRPVWERQNNEELNLIVEKLLAVKRPRAAFNCVELDIEKIRPTILFKLMDAIPEEEPQDQEEIEPLHIEEAFEVLNRSTDFSIEQMAGLELVYLDLLSPSRRRSQGNGGIPNLEKYIDQNPEFFAKVVAWVYKRSDGRTDPGELQLNNPADFHIRAKRGYKLIESLQSIPGRNKHGNIDLDLLLGWTHTVRKICADLGRQDVGDISIGKLFSEAPNGLDGVWPCESVRDVLEKIQSEKIAEGIIVGLFNLRGVHWRGEGGNQERELAAKYRNWASALEFSHPYVSSRILMQMAGGYERDAHNEDNEAGIRRRLL